MIQLAVLAEVGPVAVVSIPTIDIVPLGIAPALGGQPGAVDEALRRGRRSHPPAIAEHHDELLEGAPVVDGHGALIGLITYTAAGPEMMAISINEELAPPLAFCDGEHRGGRHHARRRQLGTEREHRHGRHRG